MSVLFFFHCHCYLLELTSFPTRRSSDLETGETLATLEVDGRDLRWYADVDKATELPMTTELIDDTTYYVTQTLTDRKSTRLNSSHVDISYAVFCLKKKKNKNNLS